MKKLFLLFLLFTCFIPTIYGQTVSTILTSSNSPNENIINGKAPTQLDNSYIIGAEDLITIFVWKEPDLTQTISVRPDGKISMPLLNDIEASGFTTLQLKEVISNQLRKYINEPTVTVIVQAARSQKASIMGEVARSGTYFINSPTTLIQLISLAGGFRDFALTDKISIVRQENGKTHKLKFNYRDFIKGKNLDKNIQIKPGDIVIVP